MDLLIVDTECTGLDSTVVKINDNCAFNNLGDEVIQIGGFIIRDTENYKSNIKSMDITPFCLFCDSIRPESKQKASEVHHLSSKEIRKYVRGIYLPQVIKEYVPELLGDNAIFLGHNIMYDVQMIKQSLRNSFEFYVKKFTSSVLPTSGRIAVDTVDFTKTGTYRQKLSNLATKYKKEVDKLLEELSDLEVLTNSPELLLSTNNSSHNALFDSTVVFAIWRDIWMKKIL